MRRTYVPAVAAGAFMLVTGASIALAQDTSRAVSGGGISLPGWAGKIDAAEAGRGAKLEDSKLAKMGNDMHVTTGPAVAYWNPANKATGNYTVKATFTAQGGGGIIKDIAHVSAVLGNCEGEGNGNQMVGNSLPLQVPVVLKLKLPPTGVGTSAATMVGALALLSMAVVSIRQLRRSS